MTVRHGSVSRWLWPVLAATVLSGCGHAGDGGGGAPDTRVAAASPPSPVNQAALVDEIVASLQACSYDGAPVKVEIKSGAAPNDCRDMVARIMQHTGLPQNFTVVEAPVPNAAALIRLDAQRMPERVIAFNRDFMNIVRRATGNNDWAPVSIMAHEIGHHLSGHTITPGGSQPPTELEADKFSGFVLYRMGASLDDSLAAMLSLVPDDDHGSHTHPGRDARVSAIREGWQQACRQHGADTCTRSTATTAAPAPALARHDEAAPPSRATAHVDALPRPDAIPSKLDRFVYDEYGVLDPATRERFAQALYEHAERHGVEIVSLLVKDLHGLDGDAFAQAMLRQLRVGKLDVGNGAVLVVAPGHNQVGMALGPGVAEAMRSHDKRGQLRRWLDLAWERCQRPVGCGDNWTESFMLAADHIRRQTQGMSWAILDEPLGTLVDAKARHGDDRRAGRIEAAAPDPTFERIIRFQAQVVAVDVDSGYAAAKVNASRQRDHVAIHVESSDGLPVMLYARPELARLMPGGALRQGGRYSVIVRVANLSWNHKDTQELSLLSYDALD